MKQTPFRRHTLSMLIVLLACAGTAALATEPDAPHDETAAEEHAEDAHGRGSIADHSDHSQEISLFLGITNESGHGTQGTVGLEYVYRMGRQWGMGGLVDYAGGDFRNLLVGVPFVWYPYRGLKLLAAPAVEFHDGRGGEDHGEDHGEADEDGTNLAFRIGAAWDFPVSRNWRISPAVNLDLVDGNQVWVYGVNLNYAW